MNEPQFGDKIRHILNQGLSLDPRKAERLKAARELALARKRPEPVGALAWAGDMVGDLGGWTGLSLRVLAPIVMLLIGFGAIYTWQQNQRADELAEIDAQVLTGDLPIDAYLDRGFQNWLKTRAAEQ
ncbi:MAG TPA: DUF3619 family protein [Burkholderiales bacterium]|nr:DUF3619 family protein [Burkholderiales bacterium]